MSYNCAQYLQSLDRIHRVGGSEKQEAYYDILLYENTIDLEILDNLNQKQGLLDAAIVFAPADIVTDTAIKQSRKEEQLSLQQLEKGQNSLHLKKKQLGAR